MSVLSVLSYLSVCLSVTFNCALWPNGWTDEAGLGMGVGLSPVDSVLDGDPAPLPKKGAEPPKFWPMFIVAKRMDESR